MKRLLLLSSGLCAALVLFCFTAVQTAEAQYNAGDDFEVAWTLSAHENTDLFPRGPAFGARGVLTGMDFDDDGNKEILFTTDETLAPEGPDPGFLDVFLYEATGDDTYEYVWHYTMPEASNSLAALTYGDMDQDGLWEIFLGVPTIDDDPMDLFIFEQDEEGVFPDEPTATYDYDREGSLDFRPAGFALEDIDGDGDIELATVSRTAGLRELVVISLTGELDAFATFDIEFEVGEQVLGGGAVHDVDIADFDGDGMNEIWVNTWDNFSWAIFEATGDDSYALAAEINAAREDNDPGSFNSHKLLFHDVEGDGDLELFAPMSNGKLYYLDNVDDVSTINNDSFEIVGIFDETASARGGDIGDLDGNGRFDIVAGTGTAETLERIEYDGAGDPADSTSYTWTTILESTEGDADRYYPLRITDDLDGDGRNEVVVTNINATNEGQPLILVLESTVEPTDYVTSNDATLAWTLDPREFPDLFDHGPEFGTNTVLTGMDFDDDGNKEFLFSTDETVAPNGPDPGFLDVFLYEATGDDSYEHVWHWTHPQATNSFPPLAWGDMDQDGLYEIFMGVPTIDDPDKLYIFEQDEEGNFPDDPTSVYDYERDPSVDFRPAGFALEDVDGDGDIELITVSRTAGARELVVISLTGEIDEFTAFTIEFEVGETVLGGGGVYDVDVADFDGDGMSEIWVNTWDNFSWAVFEATGADSYALEAEIDAAIPVNDPGSYNRHKLLFTDVEEDGDLELYAPMTDGKLYFLDGVDDVSTITGDSFVEVGTFDETAEARGGDLGDFDGDGNLDIIVGHGNSERVSRIDYDGVGDPADSTSYEWSILFETIGGPSEYIYPLRIADDLDGDGLNEVVITNRYASAEGQPVIFILEATDAGPVAVDRPEELPSDYVLEQNYPNPFNPTTTIDFELKSAATVSVRVYDSVGRLVTTLINDEAHAPGRYSVEWNATRDGGGSVASGVYFYTLESRDARLARKMVLMK